MTTNMLNDSVAPTVHGANATVEAIIKAGLSVQHSSNTVSAIEYMKNRGIDAVTIQRVLAGFYLHRDAPRDPSQLS